MNRQDCAATCGGFSIYNYSYKMILFNYIKDQKVQRTRKL